MRQLSAQEGQGHRQKLPLSQENFPSLLFVIKENKEQMLDIYRKNVNPEASFSVGSSPEFC